MNPILLVYVAGVVLKTILNLASNSKRQDAVDNFNEAVLWPVYVLFDIFMFFVNFFS